MAQTKQLKMQNKKKGRENAVRFRTNNNKQKKREESQNDAKES